MEGLLKANAEAEASYRRGDYQQSIQYAIQQLNIAKNVGDKKEEAEAYSVLARSYYYDGDNKQSIEFGIKYLNIAKEQGNEEAYAEAYNVLAWSYYHDGDYKQSIEFGMKYLSITKELGNREEEAEAYNVLAKSYHYDRDYKQSIEFGIKYLSIAKEQGNGEAQATAYNVLAWSYYYDGDYKQSIEFDIKYLNIAKELGNREAQVEAYSVLAWSYYFVRDYKQSIEFGKKFLSIAKELGNGEAEAAAYFVLARSYYNVDGYKQSIEFSIKYLSIAKEQGNGEAQVEAYDVLAWSYYYDGDYKQSIKFGIKLLSIVKEQGNGEAQVTASGVLAWSYYYDGDYKQSIKFGIKYLRIAKELGNGEAQVVAYNVLSMSFYCVEDYKHSIKFGKKLLRIAEEQGNGEAQVEAYDVLARSYYEIGDDKQADEYVQLQMDAQKKASEDKSPSQEEAGAADTGGFGSSSVPSEVKARGPKAKLAYENALKTGKVKVHRTRIMLIGQDRAGKTSLKKSFLGLPFDPNEQSTDGIEVDPSKFEVDVDQVKNWQRTDAKLDVSHFVNSLARMVAGELEEEETKMDSKMEDNETKKKERLKSRDKEMDPKTQDGPANLKPRVNQIPNREEKRERTQEAAEEVRVGHDRVSHSENVTREPAIPELKIDPALPPEEFTDLLVQHLKGVKLQSNATTVENHMTLDLWDFAGQHLYYASYPVFLSSRAVYLLVYNLSKGLKSTAQPCCRQGSIDIHLGNRNGETNLENLFSWLASVSTMCSKPQPNGNQMTEKGPRPPIFIIGTHADKLSHQDIKEMEKEIKREIGEKDFQDHVIYPFFAIDNRQGSSSKGVQALQKRMIEVLKKEPYMDEVVPLRWFNFEKIVQALVAKKIFYLTLEQLQTIIQKVCYIENENEAATMLDFYHDLGMIVKHRNTVVLQAQWLIDVFKQLITIRSCNDKERLREHAKLWRKMEKDGTLNMKLVDHVFSKFCHHAAAKEDILKMMEQFGLIAKFVTSPTDVHFFVPCQLKTPPQEEPSPSPSDPCLLYLHFPGGFVPYGLFSQLVSRCTRWCSESGSKQPPQLFDGVSRFFIEKELSYQLVLACKKKFIKILLMQTQPDHEASFAEIRKVACLVRKFLEETMENLTRELPWSSTLAYDWRVKCPNWPTGKKMCSVHGQTSCTDEECLCLLKILEEGQPSHCPNNLCANVPTVPGLEKWFLIKAVLPVNHLSGTDDVYKMTPIINNTLFADHPEHGQQLTRHGSRVKESFDALGLQESSPQLKVALLASEWGSLKGGLSTINRMLAIHLAKQPNVEVTLLVPESECSEGDKRTAGSHKIFVCEVPPRPAFDDSLDWLICPPKDLAIDVFIGHGTKLGKQVQIIKQSRHCKWVQVVHTKPEELAMHKDYPGAIAKGEKKNKAEVALCKLADLVVTIGPKLTEAYLRQLRLFRKEIFELTPGIFANLSNVVHTTDQQIGKFTVLTFGRGDPEDLNLKGYDIAAKAIVILNDRSYRLIFVGAHDGKQDEVTQTLLQAGISKNQLIVRSFVKTVEELKELFCEVDVAIMPSRTEGFGLTALEAMSAGLPILVSRNSGFGQALCGLSGGKSQFVVESEDPKKWAKAIAAVRQNQIHWLQQIQTLRRSYEQKYSWEKQCRTLADKMRIMVLGVEKSTEYKSPVKSCKEDYAAGQTMRDAYVAQGKSQHCQGGQVLRECNMIPPAKPSQTCHLI